jgi:PAS domain S-box-containing protein
MALPGSQAPRESDPFAGAGEMGELIRAYHWRTTPLGPVDEWPQSFKTAVRILLSSRFAMWMGWGPELTFLYNDAYGRMTLGAKHPWALGRPAREVWAEIWRDIGPRIQTVLDTGSATWDEALLLFLERSGYAEETYHTFSYSPLTDDAGRRVGMLCVVVEETDRVISERRIASLRDLAAQLSATSTQDEVLAAASRTSAANPQDLPFSLIYLFEDDAARAELASCTGISPDHPAAPRTIDLDGGDPLWPARDLLDGQNRVLVHGLPALEVPYPTGVWEKPPHSAAIVPIAQQGQARPAGFLVAGINPYRQFDAAYAGFIGLVAGQIASSLGNVRAYEAERRRAETLAELDRAKTVFFSNVSHEFRTPLTLQLGPLEDALADATHPLPPPHRERLEIAHRNSLRLLKLVNTLLDFSRIEAGRVQASFEPTDLAALTADLASTFRSAVERAGLTLEVACPPLADAVYVDRDMWEKIVLNLLSNAFKFTLHGGIEVRLDILDGAARLAVSDTGTGIPAAELPRLFERFHRVRGAQGRSYEGTGIGLALVRELVRLHGGTIAVRSEPGRGSTFTVTVPLGAAHLPADQVATAVSNLRRSDQTAHNAAPYVEEALRWLPGAALPPGGDLAGAADFDRRAGAEATVGDEPGEWLLIADDNADLRDYLARLLGGRWAVTTVADGRAALAAINTRLPSLVLSDVMMPELDGFGLLAALRGDPRTREVPVILLSARAGEEARIEGLEAGADDYLVKPFSAREVVARVEAVLALARMRRAAAAAERALRAEAEARAQEFLSLAENLPDMVARFDRELRHVFVNGVITRMTGRPLEHFIGRRVSDGEGPPELIARWCAVLERVFAKGEADELDFELEFPQPYGRRIFNARFIPERDSAGRVATVVTISRDITVQRQTEDRLRQAAKMEAIGRLAGGIAHDFNNQLHGVSGFAGFIAREPGLPPRARHDLEEIQRAAERMAGLTRQLLAFSRQQVLKTETVDLNAAVTEARSLLQRPIGSSIEMTVDLTPERIWVRADRSQLLQVLLNLTINARDAMPEGGALTIRTGRRAVTAAHAGAAEAAAPALEPLASGEYVVLSVADTGTGIDPAHLPHIFEPFFTTKEVGKGTGLGLATVHGIVTQSGGQITAESTPGRGTTFTVLMPIAGPQDQAPDEPESALHRGPRRARVMVVDDEDVVRKTVARTLELDGYEVVQAENGRDALERLAQLGPVDLVLSDVVMPQLGGRGLAARLAAEYPAVAVIWMSGYPRDAFPIDGMGDGQPFLQKPIPVETLTATVRALLTRRAGTKPSP